jgi:hypothetical protein
MPICLSPSTESAFWRGPMSSTRARRSLERVRRGDAASNAAFTAYATDHTPSYTFGDTLSWTLGNHALKFGGELREKAAPHT